MLGKMTEKASRPAIHCEPSVSARLHHCGNPVLQSEMAPRKTKNALSFYKAAGLMQA